jgi:hypothetical protein
VGNFLTFHFLLGIYLQKIEEIFYRMVRASHALIFFAWNLLSGVPLGSGQAKRLILQDNYPKYGPFLPLKLPF